MFFSINLYSQVISKPNVIIILSDDQGYAHLGCYQDLYKREDLPAELRRGNNERLLSQSIQAASTCMPNIDKLATSSIRFTQAFAAPTCAPSRTMLMSAQYPQNFGIYTNYDINEHGVPASIPFLVKDLKNAGYQTAIIGKWHLGSAIGQHPNDKGFDYYFGFDAAQTDKYNSKDLFKNKEKAVAKGFLPEQLTEEAVQWIDRSHANKSPFFLCLTYNEPHGPRPTPPAKYLKPFNTGSKKVDEFYAYLYAMDSGIGKVIEKLKLNGDYENTMIIYASDNGGVLNGMPLPLNGALKGGKGMVYDGGRKVPFIVHYPKIIREQRDYNEIISFMDVMPTVLDMAGISVNTKSVQGKSFAQILKGSSKPIHEEAIFWASNSNHLEKEWLDFDERWRTENQRKPKSEQTWQFMNHPAGYTVQKGDYKLIKTFYPKSFGKESPNYELYNFKTDPGEKIDLAQHRPSIVTELLEEYKSWIKNKPEPIAWQKEQWLNFFPQKDKFKDRNDVYLSDMDWDSEANESGEISKKDKAIVNKPLEIEGITYAKGIGTHSKSRIVYQLKGQYTAFSTLYGVDDKAGDSGSVVFEVWVDNELRFQSEVIRGGMSVKELNLDIEGAKQLELRVLPTIDGIENDIADWANAKVLRQAPEPVWKGIGEYRTHMVNGNEINIQTSGTNLKFELCQNDMIRVRMAKPGESFQPNEPYTIVKYDWEVVEKNVEDKGEYLLISTAEMAVRLYKNPIRIAFYRADNQTIIAQQSEKNGFGFDGDKTVLKLNMDIAGKKEHFYGAGIQFHRFDLRGESVRVYSSYTQNKEDKGYNEVAVPFFLSSAGYAILSHNSYDTWFRFGSKDSTEISIEPSKGELDFYFMKGDNFKDLVGDYCELTGFKQMPPIKALGMTFRGMGFAAGGYGLPENNWNSDQYLSKIDELRERGVAFDIIGTEPGWSTIKGNLTWSSERFNNPEEWCRNLNKRGILPNNWMYGNVSTADTILYAQLKPFLGNRGLPDVTSKKAMDLYFDFCKRNHFDYDVLGFKEDSHGDKIDKNFKWASGVLGDEMHNSYWYIWSKALFDRYREEYNKRLFMVITPNFTGGQRYSMCSYADFGQFVDGMVRALANTGWTGIDYAPELQFYYTPDDRLKFIKSQIMAFSPYPVHNEWRGGFMPWDAGEKVFNCYQKYMQLHYRLIPYEYSYYRQCNKTGIGLIRPLPMEFQDDENTFGQSTSFMYGEYFLIAPVCNKETGYLKRDIYLPKGADWIEYETGKEYPGGTILKDVIPGLETLPIYIRKGAIIPMMPNMLYVGEKPIDELTVDIYPDTYSSFTLYEDDGQSFEYEQGNFCETKFEVSGNSKHVKVLINERHGKYIPQQRNYLLQLNIKSKPDNITITNNKGEKLIKEFNSSDKIHDLGWKYNNGIAYVNLLDTGSEIEINVNR